MSRNQARFSQLPRAAVIDTRLTPTDFKVLAIIGLYLNHDHEAWPSQNTIAEVGDMSRRTVIRAIQNLEQFGYVESRKKFPNRPGTHKCYRVVMDVTPESAKSVTSENVTSVTSGCDIAMSLPIRTSPVEHTDTNVSVLATSPEQAVQKGSGRVRGPARKTVLPESWQPGPAVLAYASKLNFNPKEISHEENQFRASAVANARRYADWDAAFRTWIGNAAKWRDERAAKGNYAAATGRQSSGSSVLAAGMRAVADIRGYGQPVSEGGGLGTGHVIEGDLF